MTRNILLVVFLFNVCSCQQNKTSTVRNIFIPTFAFFLTILIALACWKRFYRTRRPIYPYSNPQIAYVTQTYQQQQPYRPLWPPPPVEQPPPPYYTVVNTTMVPPSVSYIKQ